MVDPEGRRLPPGAVGLVGFRGDGFFHFRSRADDIINNDGVTFYPIEVETALLVHPAVSEAAVIGWPHDRLGEAAVAFLVTRQPLAAAELDRHCRRLSPASGIRTGSSRSTACPGRRAARS